MTENNTPHQVGQYTHTDYVYSDKHTCHSSICNTAVMGSSYMAPPPGTQPSLPVNPVPKNYHHLESNRALPHPPKGPPSSEAKVCTAEKKKSMEIVQSLHREAL